MPTHLTKPILQKVCSPFSVNKHYHHFLSFCAGAKLLILKDFHQPILLSYSLTYYTLCLMRLVFESSQPTERKMWFDKRFSINSISGHVKSCTKQHCLVLLNWWHDNFLNNMPNLRLKSYVQHPIRLINYKIFHLCWENILPFYHIFQTSWSCYQDVRTSIQLLELRKKQRSLHKQSLLLALSHQQTFLPQHVSEPKLESFLLFVRYLVHR